MEEPQKRYNADWAKAKSRALLKDFTEKTILRTRKPSQTYVLCFPGVDAREIFEVYDPLKIPRANIVGLERCPLITRELEAQSLGIKVVNKTLEQYVSDSSHLPFDIVSLDYTGPILPSGVNLLNRLANKQTKKSWVLHHANLSRRDPAGLEVYLWGLGGTGESNYTTNEFRTLVAAEDDTVPLLKSNAYSGLLLTALKGRLKEDIRRIQAFLGKGENEFIAGRIEKYASKYGLSLKDVDPSSLLDSFPDQSIGTRSAGDFISSAIYNDLLSRKVGIIKGFSLDHFLEILKDGFQRTKRHMVVDAQRYSYISESGSPMIGDIYHVEDDSDTLKAARRFAELFGYPGSFVFDQVKFNKSFDHLVGLYVAARKRRMETYKGLMKTVFSEDGRIFLGSSAKPVLTKSRAIKEFQDGANVEDIKAKYRGWTSKPLAQWKAHVTMGTYNAEPQEMRETIREDAEDSDLERITKDQALELLNSGIPPKEINEAYPTSFTTGQLAAFKAWQTMRSRNLLAEKHE